MYVPMRHWPEVKREAEEIRLLFGKSPLGLDLEWNVDTGEPTILGLSDGRTNVSVSWAQGLPYLRELVTKHPKTVFVGHNIVGADNRVLDGLGIHIPIEQFEDTILRWYLNNMHLCKMSQKGSLEEGGEGEKRGRGFMNLGTMLSVQTSLPYYKACRGEVCEGPCPEHDVFGYNGIDSLGPVLALPGMKRQSILRGVEKLYPMHRELADVLAEMRDFGVQIDVPYVATLREDFEKSKDELFKQLPFNPKSDKQVIAFFKERDIDLDNNQEQTIRDMVEGDGAGDEMLELLLEYKELGNGPDRWFAPRLKNEKGDWVGFMDVKTGRVHPSIAFFTSSGRLMCSSPNFQNVAKRRLNRRQCTCGHAADVHAEVMVDGKAKKLCSLCTSCKGFSAENVGKKIRRAIIAPEGHYIVRADYSNAENRVYLYLAEYEPPTEDLHTWMTNNIGIDASHPFAIAMGSPRDAAKSVTHATDYLEGLSLIEPASLRKSKIKAEIDAGARIVYPSWTFKGKVVTFTGINMARRAFGSASYEHRRNALDIRARYLEKFPRIIDLQMRITKQVERDGLVRPPHGYALLSYGFPEDRLKQAAAVWGSQPVAHISKIALLNLARARKAGGPIREVLQVHDELIGYVSNSVAPEEAVQLLKNAMEIETPEMPRFKIPTEGSFGSNWRDQTKVK